VCVCPCACPCACVVRGAWCVVRGAWCVVRGAWCVVHVRRALVLPSWKRLASSITVERSAVHVAHAPASPSGAVRHSPMPPALSSSHLPVASSAYRLTKLACGMRLG
jgi:hypothetical protein